VVECASEAPRGCQRLNELTIFYKIYGPAKVNFYFKKMLSGSCVTNFLRA